MLPLGVQNFTKACARQDQEPDGGNGVWIERHPALVSLWRVLGAGLRFVNLVRQANGFAFPERVTKAGKLFAAKEALTAMFAIALNCLGGIIAKCDFTTLGGPIPNG